VTSPCGAQTSWRQSSTPLLHRALSRDTGSAATALAEQLLVSHAIRILVASVGTLVAALVLVARHGTVEPGLGLLYAAGLEESRTPPVILIRAILGSRLELVGDGSEVWPGSPGLRHKGNSGQTRSGPETGSMRRAFWCRRAGDAVK
jgi:hypothetical protein